MNKAESSPPKAKKSVVLSGVIAGNTAISSVGRTGNDLHYRGYDILDVADTCEFEEIAYLLVHEKLPTQAELAAYKAKLKNLRALPEQLESRPGSDPRNGSSHGCPAYRRFRIRDNAAGGGSTFHRRRTRSGGQASGLSRLHIALLVPLFPSSSTHRSSD